MKRALIALVVAPLGCAAVAVAYPGATLTPTQTTVTVGNLDCGTNYQIRVREWRSGAWRDSNTYQQDTLACSTPAPTPAGFVTKTPGGQLQLDGQPYRFTGLNYVPFNRPAPLFDCGTVPQDLSQDLTDWGSGKDAMRAWTYQSWATTTDASHARTWQVFDETLAAMKAHGLRMVATLTNEWGDCDHAGAKSESWFQSGYKDAISPGDRTTYRDYVREIAARYKDDPTILMWQLGNEIDGRSGGNCTSTASTTMHNFVSDMTSVIRSVDPNHLISTGNTGGWCGSESIVPSVDVCDWHDYGEPLVTLPQSLVDRINECSALGRATMVGEEGIGRSEVGTLQDRADAFGAKLSRYFPAGIAGYLIWEWQQQTGCCGQWSVTTGDPVLPVLGTTSAGAFPDASTTGVPAGTTLTTLNGDQTINTTGAVIDSKLINGCVVVNAPNVTIKRSKIVCHEASAIDGESTGLVVSDSEIDCGNAAGRTGITWQNYTAVRINAHGCENTAWAEHNVTIQDSYLHDNVHYDPFLDPHTDGVQLPTGASNITIRHSTIYGGYVNQDDFGNSAITTAGGMSNILFTDNLLAGGGYTLRCQGAGGSNFSITGNRFTTALVSAVGGFGPTDGFCRGATTAWSDNVYLDGPQAGAPVE
jgi:mannan endo-1,4-beta-mannosidase